MKKEYEKPCFVPVVLEANVLASPCAEKADDGSITGGYTLNSSWMICPVDIGRGMTVFNGSGCMMPGICVAGGYFTNTNIFGS